MPDRETIRTFVALELPEKLKESIVQLQRHLECSGADVKWVRTSGFHLTMKFLGSVPQANVPDIIDALEPITGHHHRMRITVRGVGAFPNQRKPRVVWVGMKGSESLNPLQADIEKAMDRIGFEPEARPFIPHLTLGRVKSLKGHRELVNALKEQADWSTEEFELTRLHLMKSELHSRGAVYTSLWSKILDEI